MKRHRQSKPKQERPTPEDRSREPQAPVTKEPRPEDTGMYEAGPVSEATQRAANRDLRPSGNRGTVREPEPLSVDADELGRRALEELTGER